MDFESGTNIAAKSLTKLDIICYRLTYPSKPGWGNGKHVGAGPGKSMCELRRSPWPAASMTTGIQPVAFPKTWL